MGASATTSAIRSSLEACDVRVNLFQVGQARHVVSVLSGREGSSEFVIMDCHGADGNILLPDLSEEIEARQPFHGVLTADDLRSIVDLPGRTVLSTGCQTGNNELAQAFLDGGCDAYIGPAGGPFGHGALFAIVWIFYELTQMRSLDDAVARLQRHDDEQAMWRLYRR